MSRTSSPASQSNNVSTSPRIALLFQGAGHYWQPILSEFVRLLPNTVVFTPAWPGFLPGFEDAFVVKQVGTMKVFSTTGSKGYSPSFTYLSPSIIGHLLQFKPEIIFSTAFSLWTMIAVLLKPIFRWRVVIVYDGSSPGVDYAGSKLRLWQRRWMAAWVDAFITNNQAGKIYLTDVVGTTEAKVFARPYLIPDLRTYAPTIDIACPVTSQLQHPIFIFAGKLIPRKGLQELLKACALLQAQGYQNYSLLVLGDGQQRQELERFVEHHHFASQVQWMGNVEYEQVGSYLFHSDVFIFPTLEDVWGLVAVEAMMFGKPILCSKRAGAAEMVVDGENGYVFDPQDTKKFAELMGKFIENPALINQMGEESKQLMASHTPADVSKFLATVVNNISK